MPHCGNRGARCQHNLVDAQLVQQLQALDLDLDHFFVIELGPVLAEGGRVARKAVTVDALVKALNVWAGFC